MILLQSQFRKQKFFENFRELYFDSTIRENTYCWPVLLEGSSNCFPLLGGLLLLTYTTWRRSKHLHDVWTPYGWLILLESQANLIPRTWNHFYLCSRLREVVIKDICLENSQITIRSNWWSLLSTCSTCYHRDAFSAIQKFREKSSPTENDRNPKWRRRIDFRSSWIAARGLNGDHPKFARGLRRGGKSSKGETSHKKVSPQIMRPSNDFGSRRVRARGHSECSSIHDYPAGRTMKAGRVPELINVSRGVQDRGTYFGGTIAGPQKDYS